ncbi:MAG TPA: NAD(P)-dependent oxidoreductase [Candidatus Gemmiger faecigallinarum]|nr:NAD(P)-dependent oxidoreductase [Candidatus Gemmiger faecigallinarum]
MKLGFIGIGTMGLPMSLNLSKKSGCAVTVYDRSPAAIAQAPDGALHVAGCAGDVADQCDVIFTMLPRSEHVQSVYTELLPHIRPGQIFVDMSTISPSVSRAVAGTVRSRGADFADAPVVKSRPAAVDGTLGIYVGGREETFRAVLPLLQCMGSSVLYLGDNGAGLVMKLCHNALVAQIQNGVNETLHLARTVAGIDAVTFARAAAVGGAQAFYLDSKAAVIQAGDYTPAFCAEYMHKDIGLAMDLCREAGLHFSGIELTARRYDDALARGWGREDFSCTYKLLEHGD